MSHVLPALSTSFIVISAIFVAFGWIQIARRKIEAHRKLMSFAALFASLFFIFYLSRTLLVGNTLFGGPDNIRVFYLTFLLFHIVLATVGGVMGLITLRWGFKNELAKHRKIGPWTSIVWFCTAITGVTVYYLLYIKYPGGETGPVWKAIFG
jgi:putative membrane protein